MTKYIWLVISIIILIVILILIFRRHIFSYYIDGVEHHLYGGDKLMDKIFRKHNIKPKGVIHIGAHDCEERYIYHKYGISDNNIIWIEGNPLLVERIKNNIPSAKIYQGLIADIEKEVDFIITNNEQSSSILELKEHSKEHPHIKEINRTKMKTITLPKLLNKNNINYKNFDFLTMDIQCAEYLALKGMKDILRNFKGIFMEVNIKELYNDCASLDKIKDFLKPYGFVLKDLWISEYGWGDGYFSRIDNKN